MNPYAFYCLPIPPWTDVYKYGTFPHWRLAGVPPPDCDHLVRPYFFKASHQLKAVLNIAQAISPYKRTQGRRATHPDDVISFTVETGLTNRSTIDSNPVRKQLKPKSKEFYDRDLKIWNS